MTSELFLISDFNNNATTCSFVESEKCRLTCDCHLNISYGPTERQKLDIYGDNLVSSAPIFIFIHGGYWQMLDKEGSSFFVKSYLDQGIRVIIPDYDSCPNVTLEEITIQIRRCFKWIADYICKNGISRISIAGHSAGSHLLSYGMDDEFLNTIFTFNADIKIDAYFLSGIYFLEELRHLKAANDNDILSINDDNCRRLSPQYSDFSYIKKYAVKVHVFAGEYESEKFREHSKKFAEGPMKDFLVTFKILDVDHFDMIEKLSKKDYELTNLIITQLKK